ncbi:MAG: hypothetical protein AB8B56_20370 [Crocinitomicaceae bacterium]
MVILPNEINGNVQLNISAIPNLDIEKLGYEYFSVFVENEGAEYSSNAVQGRHTIEEGYLVFSPYFPFERGMNYVIRTKNTDVDSDYSYQSFQVGKKRPVDEAKVINVYPLAHELPENLLRFYMYFNTPMKKGQALQHVELADAQGNVDNRVFMEFKQELWSADGKRLTLLFDPGRIKRGVSTNVALGPALLEGNMYQLNISGEWQDVHGQDLSVDFTKEFVVGQAYRQHIKVNDLAIDEPEANSLDALTINFSRVMDHALIQSMIQLKNEENHPIAGRWGVSQDETKAIFFPEETWETGSYHILFNGSLEDVTGNNLDNLLDEKTNKEHNGNPQQLTRLITI